MSMKIMAKKNARCINFERDDSAGIQIPKAETIFRTKRIYIACVHQLGPIVSR